MNIADENYKRVCNEILLHGVYDSGDIRAKWDDGTPAHTKHIFGVTQKYDLSNGSEFPIMSLRKCGWKNALDEILWIWQKHSNNVCDLNSHIWDAWADNQGTIGKAYGYQLGKLYDYHDGTPMMNQVDRVLWDLKHNRNSRRIMASMWNVQDLHEMRLQPCAYSMTFNVCGNKLNGLLNQRSQDMLTANNWNIVQYSMLLMMIAQASGLETGEILHVISDCHIYDRHEDMVREMIESDNNYDPLLIGTDVILNPDKKDFYTFEMNDWEIRNYNYNQFNHKIPVAI